ncbi:MAG: hypothetical protein OPY06_02470 [Nitrosopumilus sp.]|nr:hypothetical protein [Nitrosopumilus sp.]MDF2422693.1 hypothetical protein [Nitrosopumilus sp.]MDF2423928.1 hypothetical protein [Nitrosopumilus sp.]MDF2426380.1 hypothetical protein [Nitrosopumilus sp.]MDF2427894.1 hypothetical protein [Nitrosopumilus sp.]
MKIKTIFISIIVLTVILFVVAIVVGRIDMLVDMMPILPIIIIVWGIVIWNNDRKTNRILRESQRKGKDVI